MGNLISVSLNQVLPKGINLSESSKHTISSFDPEKYQGKWWELARYPIKWETDCQRATAIYEYNKRGEIINVVNQCRNEGVVTRERKAIAWISNPKEPGKLKLRFVDDGPSDSADGDYWIHWTDYDNYSIVGGPTNLYLWILSRKEQVNKHDAHMLLAKVKSFGYNPDKLMANKSVILE